MGAKYGNDDPYVDQMLYDSGSSGSGNDLPATIENLYGEPYSLDVCFTHGPEGAVIAATADGRPKELMPAGRLSSAYPGTDTMDSSACLESATGWDSRLLEQSDESYHPSALQEVLRIES